MVELNKQLANGFSVKLIFDKDNFKSSSCARQPLRMKELYESGAELRVMRPLRGGFACMHAKTVILDEKVILTGSVNLTHEPHP